MYVPLVWDDVTEVSTRLDRLVYEISVMFASTVLPAAGALLVSATVRVSAPRLWVFSAKASTKELNLLKVATRS